MGDLPPLRHDLYDGAPVRSAEDPRTIMDMLGRIIKKGGDRGHLRFHDTGKLEIATGRLVACDPKGLTMDDLRVFARTVSPGEHPTFAATLVDNKGHSRVVLAGVWFKLQTPTRYELALFEGEDPAILDGDEEMRGGVGVDYYCACVADASHAKQFRKDSGGEWRNVFDDQLSAILRPNSVGSVGALGHPNPCPIALWYSGYGSGMYTPFWGLDANNEICNLVIDFEILENGLP